MLVHYENDLPANFMNLEKIEEKKQYDSSQPLKMIQDTKIQ